MLNMVVLIGNLGADPDIRTTPSGIKVAKMRLAVTDAWTNRSSGEKEKRTHWVDLTAWDRLAQTAERYLTRGQRIAIRGSLEYREWTAADGSKRNKLEVRVKEMIMLSSKDQGSPSPRSYPQSQQSPDSYSNPPGRAHPARAASGNQADETDDYPDNSPSFNDDDAPVEDDDIPF